MLQAEAKVYSSDVFPVYQEKQAVRQMKRTVKKVNHKRKVIVIAGSLLFIYALLLVFLCTQTASLSYQINTLQKEIESMQTEQNVIEYQISQAQSLEHVEKAAANDLGMVKPMMATSIIMQTHNQPVQIADTKIENNHNISQSPLKKIYTNLSRLAQKTIQ